MIFKNKYKNITIMNKIKILNNIYNKKNKIYYPKNNNILNNILNTHLQPSSPQISHHKYLNSKKHNTF